VIVCVHLPRFELVIAKGSAEALVGRAVAIEPADAGAPRVGEVSGTAQRIGVTEGMWLSDALACCPTLELVLADPVGVRSAWEQIAQGLEGIGAELEAPRPGLAYFEADGLEGLYRGRDRVIAAARHAVARPCRIGAGPTQFCALAACREGSRSARIVGERDVRRYLAGQPVGLLRYREQTAPLVPALEQLGVRTLGEVAGFGADALADRFGHAGSEARRLALGDDGPLVTRRVEDRLEEWIEVEQSNSAEVLERTLRVLIDRLLARSELRGRTIRALTLAARLVESGTWCEPVVFRSALADRGRIALAVGARLRLLPAPAEALGLSVHTLGPATGEQGTLLDGERTARMARLQSAAEQIRTIGGPYAVLRVVQLDPQSRAPDRWVSYTPFAP
jgi:protein ImuB